MRKIVLLVMTLVLSLTLSSAAFAHQRGSLDVCGDSQSGSVSNGYQGYSWYHSDADQNGGHRFLADVNYGYIGKYSDFYREKISKLENILFRHDRGNRHQHWDYDRDSERYFYVDDNGVNHYFYLDPDRDYDVHQYADENGITQYWFEDNGWK
ncbi:MAG: hypothetical protein A4E55_02181 [Pelotomaculum sp. PtaU1.Bin035]|nr:MAG: hypothetical protein A4E55_02181 [Pelotomaculum sp. PtaU1.Bin035]